MRRNKTGRRQITTPSVPATRPANAEQLLSDLAQIEGLGLRAAIELRHLGMGVTADALSDLLDRIRHIRAGAVKQIQDAAAEAEERALLDGIADMVDAEMREVFGDGE